MPQIPYSPVPDVAPSSQGAPSMRIQVPSAAFGENVANAIGSVGGDLDKVGNELWTRAMAIQDLNNRADADQAVANLTEKVGLRHAAFSSLQGEAAAKGLDPYMADLHQMRDDGGQNLNPMALKLYNSESRGLISRTVFNGAGHAGQQAKVYQAKSAQAVLDQNADGVFLNPQDNASFKTKLNSVDSLIATQGGVGGWGPEQIQHETFKAKSELWRQRIIGLARSDPPAAEAMLKAAKENLEFKDWSQADTIVKHEMRTTFSRVAADNINEGWDPRMTQQEKDRAAGVQEPLVRIVQEAQRAHPELRFTIGQGGGVRTQAQQDALFAQGPSVTRTRDSNHLYGLALDVVPGNKSTTTDQIEAAMKEASIKLGIPLSPEHDKIRSWDPGHFSLPRDIDYAKIPAKVSEPLQDQINRARTFARENHPDDADFGDALENRVRARFNQDLAVKRDFDFRNNTTVGNALLGGLGDKLPTNVEELRSISPEVAAAYDAQSPNAKRNTLKYLTQNSKDDFTANEDRFRKFMNLKGQAETDPATFLDTDVQGLEMPRSWRKELLNLQLQKQKTADQDPRVTHALSVLGPMLQSAQVTRQDKDRYQVFVGALQGELKRFSDDNKRPPKMEEIQEIGSRLLQEQNTHWWQSSNRAFEQPIPDDDRKGIEEAITKRNVIPTEDMVRRIWLAKKFQDLYSKPVAEEAAKPKVPQSK